MKIRTLETQEFRMKIKETSTIQSYGNTSSKPEQLGCGLSVSFQIYARLKLRKMTATWKEF